MNDINSLSHTRWNCKYHIVFAPKYRRKVFYKEKRREVGKILRELCEWKKIKIVEAEVCPDHVHMLLEIPPKYSVSSFVGFLKREEQPNAVRKVSGAEVQIPEPGVLVPRVLCRHGREEHETDRGVHQAPAG